MGSEIYGFIQYKGTNGEYIMLPLFNQLTEHVNIWGGSAYVEALHDIGSVLSEKEKKDIEAKLTLNEMGIDEDYYEDEDFLDWHSISLPYLKLLAYKAKDKSERNIFKSLAQKIEAAVSLTGRDFLSIDDIRYIYYISY